MNNLRKLKRQFVESLLSVYTVNEADWLFFLFLEKWCGLTKEAFFAGNDCKIDAVQWNETLRRLRQNEPWQYIAGETAFGNVRLQVQPGVLIPRPETEELAWIIKRKHGHKKSLKILDLASGSGALAVFLAKNLPDAEVAATDYRDDILHLIEKNARQNGVSLQLFRGDILKDEFPAGPFDLVVSNPPYLLPGQIRNMHERVKEFEPHDALFAPGDNPVLFYEKIIRWFGETAPENAFLYFEINPLTKDRLEEILQETGMNFAFSRDMREHWRFLEIWK